MTSPICRAVIALGSNMGDSPVILKEAVVRLEMLGVLKALSSLYLTEPWGLSGQNPFYNAVAVLDTTINPAELLSALHQIENDYDRERRVRWGPRTLDLDLVLYGDVVLRGEVTVPHPRFQERRFVLEPLLEIWPQVCDPQGRPVSEWLLGVCDQGLSRLEEKGWPGPWALDSPATDCS